jgi:demethoxyubiquinone hydroxylase (CLK1/Coq7/Cat5 family)
MKIGDHERQILAHLSEAYRAFPDADRHALRNLEKMKLAERRFGVDAYNPNGSLVFGWRITAKGMVIRDPQSSTT